MKKNKPSLISILALSALLLNVLAVSIFAAINYYSYETLAQKQSVALLNTLHDRTRLYFSGILKDVEISNEMILDQIKYNQFFDEDNLKKVEDYLVYQSEELMRRGYQVSEIAYGDERGRYVGVRINADGTRSLKLLDNRTDDKFTIFSTIDPDSQIIQIDDDYDVQTRPWYAPVAKSPYTQWTDIYVNRDEKMNLTLSVSSPLWDENQLTGVIATEISLSNLNSYLKKDKEIGNGAIYYVDKDNKLIVNSSNQDYYKFEENNHDYFSLSYANEVDNPVISSSMKHIIEQDVDGMFSYKNDGERYFGFTKKVDNHRALDMRMVIVIPEEDLLSTIRTQHNQAVLSIVFIISLVLLLEVFILTKVTAPINKATKAAKRISDGDFSVVLGDERFDLRETHELTMAFNHMVDELDVAFGKLKDNEKELERKIEEKTSELETTYGLLLEHEKLASLGGLVAGLSHEINTPIGVSVSAVSYLSDKNQRLQEALSSGEISKSDLLDYIEDLQESTHIIQSNLSRASDLIVNFKQIAVDQSSFGNATFNVKEYIESIFLTLKPEYKNEPVSYQIICDENLEIYSSPGAISQVITNLLLNSLKHGIKEREELKIIIEVETRGNQLLLYYKDDGKGIEKEHIQHIFEPFFTTKVNQGGTGLGLSIVYNLVTGTLKGNITIASELNQGVCFKIELPLELED